MASVSPTESQDHGGVPTKADVARRRKMNQQTSAELSKQIISRILEATSNISKTVLEEMSLAAQLNVLFLLRGSYGSLGDYATTSRALRHLVGEDAYWRWPELTKAEAAESTAVN
jgi:hypothetical protein